PEDSIAVTVDAVRTVAQAEEREKELAELVDTEVERGELPRQLETGLVPVSALRERVQGQRVMEVSRSATRLHPEGPPSLQHPHPETPSAAAPPPQPSPLKGEGDFPAAPPPQPSPLKGEGDFPAAPLPRPSPLKGEGELRGSEDRNELEVYGDTDLFG